MKYLLRTVSFLAKKGIVIVVVIGILATIFTSAMNLSNMYILISDGLELRAATILGTNDGVELKKYFSSDFLDNDPMLLNSPYRQYRIIGASYSPAFERLWAWPWQTTTTAVVTERVVLEGELKSELISGELRALLNGRQTLDPENLTEQMVAELYALLGEGSFSNAQKQVMTGEAKLADLTQDQRDGLMALLNTESLQATAKQAVAAPFWENARYEVVLRKTADGSWIITRITQVETLPEATLRPNR